MSLWVFVAAVVLAVGARLVGQFWFWRRWVANGISPTRAAMLSIAVTQLPVLALFLGLVWASGDADSWTDLVLLAALVMFPSLMWFGLRRATFEYMDRYGVRDELKRHQK